MGHCLEDAKQIRVRLNRIVGQLNGVQKMIDDAAPCEDILTQINAANCALQRIGLMILEEHLRHCVREGIEKGNADEVIENFAEALEHFSKIS
ncbi:MAG: metal-sensing transcriptional repressor [Kiritimatiellae bacterium]|nr:metal-sensing transcriptional repressor [Kiritimatiellia bacterium]MBR4603427.1 metal-sensing transcriptional repressor [Kiritimatiellia bacterium]